MGWFYQKKYFYLPCLWLWIIDYGAGSGYAVKAIAELIGEHDTRLWRILHHYVKEARDKLDYSKVRQVGVDETSFALVTKVASSLL